MSANLTTKEASHLLRRLHTLLVLGKRSNTLALALRRALDEIRQWPQSLPFAAHFEKRPPRLVFAGYGPKFIKLIQELIDHGSMHILDTLQQDYSPFFCELCELPGIGETVARRMSYERMIETYEDLCVAFANNVLAQITGFGDTRVRIIEAWINARTTDPTVAACDVVTDTRPSHPSMHAEITKTPHNADALPESEHATTTYADDFSEEDVFGNELDSALMEDLAALPSLSFENAKKACQPTTIDADPISHTTSLIKPEAHVQNVSYLKAAHVSQIDLNFSQTDTRTAHCSQEQRLSPAQRFANWAMTRILPPTFIARYIAMARIHATASDDELLIIGNRMEILVPCIASYLRDHSIALPIITSAVCPEQGLYARIIVDPLLCLELLPEQIKNILSRLAPNGIALAAVPAFSRIPDMPSSDDNVAILHDAAHFADCITFHSETIDFMTLCRFVRTKT
jgi:hypothetical protein